MGASCKVFYLRFEGTFFCAEFQNFVFANKFCCYVFARPYPKETTEAIDGSGPYPQVWPRPLPALTCRFKQGRRAAVRAAEPDFRCRCEDHPVENGSCAG